MIAEITAGDVPALLPLNEAHAEETSSLTQQAFETLRAQAFAALMTTDALAFVLALDQAAEYASPNFRWFQSRLERFVYIDRIITAAEARGRGHGRALYQAVAARARAAGHDCLTCEVNQQPPNPGSDAFHAALGFQPIGVADLHGGKSVRYLRWSLEA